jgi:retinol dehydrogenase-12
MIINNAGVLSPSEFTLTENGFEYSFQVNFLSHLLLDELIRNERNDAEPLTIVSVTSPVYRYNKPLFKVVDKNSYRPFKSYADSKFYVLLIGGHLHNKYHEKNLQYFGFDPGTFSSGIYRMQRNWFKGLYKIAAPFMRNPSMVASYLATILEQENHLNGAVYSRVNKFRYPEFIKNESSEKFMKECGNFLDPYIGQTR